jgi:hypothetical protein
MQIIEFSLAKTNYFCTTNLISKIKYNTYKIMLRYLIFNRSNMCCISYSFFSVEYMVGTFYYWKFYLPPLQLYLHFYILSELPILPSNIKNIIINFFHFFSNFRKFSNTLKKKRNYVLEKHTGKYFPSCLVLKLY